SFPSRLRTVPLSLSTPGTSTAPSAPAYGPRGSTARVAPTPSSSSNPTGAAKRSLALPRRCSRLDEFVQSGTVTQLCAAALCEGCERHARRARQHRDLSHSARLRETAAAGPPLSLRGQRRGQRDRQRARLRLQPPPPPAL